MNTTHLLGQPLHQSLQTDLVDQSLGERLVQHILPAANVLIQIRLLKLGLELVKSGRKLVRNGSSGLGTLVTEPFLGDTSVLLGGVLANLLLNVLDIALVCKGKYKQTVLNHW